jgi:hypothetical protein
MTDPLNSPDNMDSTVALAAAESERRAASEATGGNRTPQTLPCECVAMCMNMPLPGHHCRRRDVFILSRAHRLQRFLLSRNIWLTDAEALAGVAAVEGRT